MWQVYTHPNSASDFFTMALSGLQEADQAYFETILSFNVAQGKRLLTFTRTSVFVLEIPNFIYHYKFASKTKFSLLETGLLEKLHSEKHQNN
jgi:hypothetical protein